MTFPACKRLAFVSVFRTTSWATPGPQHWMSSLSTQLTSHAVEQCITRFRHASRQFGPQEAWFWRRCAVFKRRGTKRLRTCIGIRWLSIHPEARGPRRSTSTLALSGEQAREAKPSPPTASARSSTTQDRPRPKSGGRGPGRLRLLLMMLLYDVGVQPTAGARVATSTGVAGVPDPGSFNQAIVGTKHGGEFLHTGLLSTPKCRNELIAAKHMDSHRTGVVPIPSSSSSASIRVHHTPDLPLHVELPLRGSPQRTSP